MNTLTKPERTPTRTVREPSVPQSTEAHEQAHRIWSPSERVAGSGWTLPVLQGPPEDALLKVVMTFGDGAVRMEAVDIGVSVEGRTAPEVYGLLVDAASRYLATSGGERVELLNHPSDSWFKFVSPDRVGYEHNAADFWPEGESVEDFIEAATEGRYEEDEPDS